MTRYLRRAAMLAALLCLAALTQADAASTLTFVGCGDTVDTDITLGNSLFDCTTDGIIVGASEIEIDLNGHTVDGNATNNGKGTPRGGVQIPQEFGGVTVTNGFIREFEHGVAVESSENTVEDLTLILNAQDGVQLGGPDTTCGCLADLNEVSDNMISGNGEQGIYDDGTNNEITDNFVLTNGETAGDSGIHAEGTGPSTIEDNIITGNYTGILLDNGPHNVDGNEIQANTSHGIEIGSGAGHTIAGNTVQGNAGNGIRTAGDNHVLTKNTVGGNRLNGIFVDGGSGVVVTGNKALENVENGIDVDGTDHTIGKNTANTNGFLDGNQDDDTGFGIDANGALAGLIYSKNKAAGNADPAQCDPVFVAPAPPLCNK